MDVLNHFQSYSVNIKMNMVLEALLSFSQQSRTVKLAMTKGERKRKNITIFSTKSDFVSA